MTIPRLRQSRTTHQDSPSPRENRQPLPPATPAKTANLAQSKIASDRLRRFGTTTSADFCSHEPGHPGRPAFQVKPYSRVRSQISPNKGRELSLRKCVVYKRDLSETVS